MKRTVFSFLVLVALIGAVACSRGKVYPLRWFYVSNGLRDDSAVEEIRELVQTASEHGLNGMYFSSGFDAIDLKDDDYLSRLEQVKEICAEHNVEIIPRCLDVGYNGGLLSHDRNLAAGIPVEDALFVVKRGKAELVADPPVKIANGGFEKYSRDAVAGFSFPGKIGEVVFVDTEEVKQGKAALRFENFGGKEGNPGRLVAEVSVHPRRLYRINFWVKTDDLDPAGPFGSGRFRVQVLGGGERALNYYNVRVPSTSDWQRIQIGFNSKDYDRVEISLGVFGGKQGRFWLDGVEIEEIALVNLLRRPGTPLTVRGEKSGTVYEEGVDYAPVADPDLRSFRFDHEGPPIRILDSSRIRDGERLRVSFYHGVAVYQSQVTACVSEPAVYEIWRNNVRLIDKYLKPSKYFLSVDEVRAGGTCKACKDRNMTMGEILGDCITRQVAIVREVNPEAELIIWSDMLDPNHNAGTRRGNYYYHVDEPFTGSWEHVPNDLIIACWFHRMRYESLEHFSGLGFRTMACGYYDRDDIANDTTWLEALDATPGAMGIMYTTWLRKYELMDEFGDLVSQHRIP